MLKDCSYRTLILLVVDRKDKRNIVVGNLYEDLGCVFHALHVEETKRRAPCASEAKRREIVAMRIPPPTLPTKVLLRSSLSANHIGGQNTQLGLAEKPIWFWYQPHQHPTHICPSLTCAGLSWSW